MNPALDPQRLPEQLNVSDVFLYRQLAARGSSTALHTCDGTVSYAQLADQASRAAVVFRGLGLELEQRVLLMLPDVPEFASAWFGVSRAGGVVAAVHPEQKPDETAYYLNYTRASLLVVHQSALDAVVWLFTSGSTGFPKAAVHKQRDFVFNALCYGLPIIGYGDQDIGLAVPKLAFGYALGTNLLFPLLAGGSAVLFPEKSTPERLFALIARFRPTVLTSVPTAINAMVSSADVGSVDFSSLRVCISAGEALPAELYHRWKRATGVEILDGIGSAEMFHIFITNRFGDVKLGSLGRVVEGYEAKICDDAGQEVPRDEIGTLWIRGGSTALEYWQQREKSCQTFRGDWCVSADKFRQDQQDYFWFCGRADDMLKVGGKWLSPIEVENALLSHSAVQEAAVIAFKDADSLDKPKAFVVLASGHKPGEALAEEIKSHVRARLAPYKAPREIQFVSSLPKSDRGKVLKSQLRG